MPWRSRIESERTRRWVLAAIMLAVLGVCTLMAGALTADATPERTAVTTGPFRWLAPASFDLHRRHARNDVEFIERFGAEGRTLRVALLGDRRLRPPIAAREEAVRLLAPVSQWVDPRASHDGPLSAFCWTSLSEARTGDGRRALRKHLLAVATEDGRAYLAIYLAGFGRPRDRDYQTLYRFLETLDDARWKPRAMDTVRMSDLRLQTPGEDFRWLAPDEGAPGDTRVLYARQGRPFLRAHVRPDEAEASAADRDRSTLARLKRHVELAFVARHGQPPPEQWLAAGSVGPIPAARATLAIGPDGEPVVETWAALRGAWPLALRVDLLTANGADLEAARRAVQQLIAQLPDPAQRNGGDESAPEGDDPDADRSPEAGDATRE